MRLSMSQGSDTGHQHSQNTTRQPQNCTMFWSVRTIERQSQSLRHTAHAQTRGRESHLFPTQYGGLIRGRCRKFLQANRDTPQLEVWSLTARKVQYPKFTGLVND